MLIYNNSKEICELGNMKKIDKQKNNITSDHIQIFFHLIITLRYKTFLEIYKNFNVRQIFLPKYAE